MFWKYNTDDTYIGGKAENLHLFLKVSVHLLLLIWQNTECSSPTWQTKHQDVNNVILNKAVEELGSRILQTSDPPTKSATSGQLLNVFQFLHLQKARQWKYRCLRRLADRNELSQV